MKPLSPLQVPGFTKNVVHVQDLRAAGVKSWRLYAGDLVSPMYGTRAAPDIVGTTWEIQAAALQTLLSPGQFVSRRSAAKLLNIPLPWQLTKASQTSTLEVGAVRPRRPPEHKGVVGHQVQPGVLNTLPTAPTWLPDPADAWALLAPALSVDSLVIAGDHLISTVRRQKSLGCTLEQLAEAVARFNRCAGIGKLRDALPRLRLGVASPPETQTRLLIVRSGLPEPITNCPVQTPGRVLHADLGYPQWRIAIEYDGAYHFTGGEDQAKFDNDRCERMRDAGWMVMRLTSLDLRNPKPFLTRLERAILEALGRHAAR